MVFLFNISSVDSKYPVSFKGSTTFLALLIQIIIQRNINIKCLVGRGKLQWVNMFQTPWILKLAGIPQELWIIQDYISDLLVPMLASVVTLDNVNIVENVSLGSKAVLSKTLYFTKLRLFEVNAKVLGFKECVIYLWETMIWFTSFLKPLGKCNYLDKKGTWWQRRLQVSFYFQGEIIQILDTWHHIQMSPLLDQ